MTKYLSNIHTGDHFGSWEVVGSPYTDERGRAKVEVRCSCGEEAHVFAYKLVNGKSTQCSKCSRSSLYSRTVRSATALNVSSTISPIDISESFSEQSQTCAVTEHTLSAGDASVVRISNSAGYVPENIMVVGTEVKKFLNNSGWDLETFAEYGSNLKNTLIKKRKRKSTTEFFKEREDADKDDD